MDKNRGLWRGKTTPKHSGEAFDSVWVEGDLIHSEEFCYIHPFVNTVKVQGELGRLIVMHEIDPSTLGECSGIPDINKKIIFEGDICEYRHYYYYDPTVRALMGLDGYTYSRGEVVYRNGEFGLWVEDEWFRLCKLTTPGRNLVIIGNIHDNPELLLKTAEESEVK